MKNVAYIYVQSPQILILLEYHINQFFREKSAFLLVIFTKLFTKYILGQHTGVGVEVDGMWQALFVTFLVYAMMPLKTWIAVAFSTMIAGTHITVTSFLDNTKIGHHWQQVIY